MIKRLLVTAAVAGAMLVPAAPSNAATTCQAADPTVDFVVCDVVYGTVAPLACRVKLLCY